jgi:hypothetical protein
MCKKRKLRSEERGVEMTAAGGCTGGGSKGGSVPVDLVDEIEVGVWWRHYVWRGGFLISF